MNQELKDRIVSECDDLYDRYVYFDAKSVVCGELASMIRNMKRVINNETHDSAKTEEDDT